MRLDIPLTEPQQSLGINLAKKMPSSTALMTRSVWLPALGSRASRKPVMMAAASTRINGRRTNGKLASLPLGNTVLPHNRRSEWLKWKLQFCKEIATSNLQINQ